MEKWSLAKDIGAGLLVGGVATGFLRGFDAWVKAVCFSGALLLLAVIIKHRFTRNP